MNYQKRNNMKKETMIGKKSTTSKFIFWAEENGKETEILRISKGKFYWKGQEVKDRYKIYERFNKWLKMAEEESGIKKRKKKIK